MKRICLTKLLALLLCATLLCGCATEPANNNPQSNNPSAENKDENADLEGDVEDEDKDDVEDEDATDNDSQNQDDTSFIVEVTPVDATKRTEMENAFSPLVEKLRNDGLLGATEKCVYLDDGVVKFDITQNDDKTDLAIYTIDAEAGIYAFALSNELWYLDGFSEILVNGIDPAPYNKEAIMIMLGMIAENPQVIFDTIDQTYFSCFTLPTDEWATVGDYLMKDAGTAYADAFSYYIKVK